MKRIPLTYVQKEFMKVLVEKVGLNYEIGKQIKFKEVSRYFNISTSTVRERFMALVNKGWMVRRKEGNKVYFKLATEESLEDTAVITKNKKCKVNLEGKFQVGDKVEFKMKIPQKQDVKKSIGNVVAKTNKFFVIMVQKENQSMYKESFLYKDILINEIQEVKINGQPITT
ncbi:winged helix-turn-helix domain-containing protein [Hathewaya histolytica]|uniref:Uncharacterized protein n=1 Tax=Hathewaya histolytica TaxID=1498 RepID=A0A4U9RAF9_HATHI|nr:winged helix-turn-helix domain-containing protein [Hathewaya histolytica]VTQ88479.1 Uncharacterised protein [Hathewaya histolytica]